jgi:hypothetical protein
MVQRVIVRSGRTANLGDKGESPVHSDPTV